MKENSGKSGKKLEILREASRRACERILKMRSDIIGIYAVGSVARGNVHQKSDADLIVLVRKGNDFSTETLKDRSVNVEIVYSPLNLWKDELYNSWGSDWEADASGVVDSFIFYDPKGLILRAKKELRIYPTERRRLGIKQIHNKMSNLSEAVWYHYVNENYDVESVFSKLFAMEALRILFPLNGVYLGGEKYLLSQVKSLPEKPRNYLRRCLSLLWFRSRHINRGEASWIINNVSKTKKSIETALRSFRPDVVK